MKTDVKYICSEISGHQYSYRSAKLPGARGQSQAAIPIPPLPRMTWLIFKIFYGVDTHTHISDYYTFDLDSMS